MKVEKETYIKKVHETSVLIMAICLRNPLKQLLSVHWSNPQPPLLSQCHQISWTCGVLYTDYQFGASQVSAEPLF